MPNIVDMGREELLSLNPASVDRPLTEPDILHIAKVLGAYWEYDYNKATVGGKPGLHARLKSGWHSDGFFVSRILLAPPNILELMARQMAARFRALRIRDRSPSTPDWVAGIPDGATDLGKRVAALLGSRNAEMRKKDGRIVVVSQILSGDTLLLVEDFCAEGTGFKEAVESIDSNRPGAEILPWEFVIINRGGLNRIVVDGVWTFEILALADHRVCDWPPDNCPLCQMGSKPIKPKVTEGNWRLITASQL